MERLALLVAVALPLAFACGFAEVGPAKTAVIGEGADAITVVYLDQPSAYERGLAYGKAMAGPIAATMSQFLQSLQWTPEQMDQVYAKQEPFIPQDIKDEMCGLAEASGVPLETIRRVHAVPELFESQCSNVVAWGAATEGGRLYALRVLDWLLTTGAQEHPVVLVERPERGNLWVGVNWAGFLGTTACFNEKQFTSGEMSAGKFYPERLEGTPHNFLMPEVLRQSDTLQEALDNFRNASRTAALFYAVGDAKIPEGRLLLTGADQFTEIRANDPTYALLGLPGIADVVYGSLKNEVCAAMLQEHYGAINPEVCKEIGRAVASDDSALHIVVFDPGNLKMWVANAEGAESAQHRPFVEFDLRQALQAMQ